MQKYYDIPFLIFYSEVSNKCDTIIKDFQNLLFISGKNSSSKIIPFYVSESLKEISPKKKVTQGIIGFRGKLTDSSILYWGDDKNRKFSIKIKEIPINEYDDYKNEAYALALILSVENYTQNDTLVSYYFKNYFKDNNLQNKINVNSYLYYYLKGSLVKAKHIYEHKDDRLELSEKEEIYTCFQDSYSRNNFEKIFLKTFFNYCIDIARSYLKEKEDTAKAIEYYNAADTIKPENEKFNPSDYFEYASALFNRDLELWLDKQNVYFEKSIKIFQELINSNIEDRLKCKCNFKLGQIYYCLGFDNKTFESSKEYFDKVIKNNCSSDLVQEANNYLNYINKKQSNN